MTARLPPVASAFRQRRLQHLMGSKSRRSAHPEGSRRWNTEISRDTLMNIRNVAVFGQTDHCWFFFFWPSTHLRNSFLAQQLHYKNLFFCSNLIYCTIKVGGKTLNLENGSGFVFIWGGFGRRGRVFVKYVGNLAMRDQNCRTFCVCSVLGNSSVIWNSKHCPALPPLKALRRRPKKGPAGQRQSGPPRFFRTWLKVAPEPRPRLKACLRSVTSGCSRRGSRPTSAGWWRSCSRSSPMRRSTWTPAPSAAGPAPWWGTLGTWRAPSTAGSSTPVIS